jgi:hypothetical protein
VCVFTEVANEFSFSATSPSPQFSILKQEHLSNLHGA